MTIHCRSCNAPILWGVTKAGKRMPLDAEPHPEGTFGITEDGHIYYQEPSDLFRDMLHKSHYSTCPDAKEWRKR